MDEQSLNYCFLLMPTYIHIFFTMTIKIFTIGFPCLENDAFVNHSAPAICVKILIIFLRKFASASILYFVFKLAFQSLVIRSSFL